MLESALVLYQDRLISVSKGQPASVDFNFDQVWMFKKAMVGKSFDPSHLYWVHVHPAGFGVTPSTQDEICAGGLTAAFGKVENFAIVCFLDDSFTNVRGRIAWYRFKDGQLQLARSLDLLHDTILIEEEVTMLKTLSYGDMWTKTKELASMA